MSLPQLFLFFEPTVTGIIPIIKTSPISPNARPSTKFPAVIRAKPPPKINKATTLYTTFATNRKSIFGAPLPANRLIAEQAQDQL